MSAPNATTVISDLIEITFIDKDGLSRQVKASMGDTLMQLATFNDIAGIDGDCGGCCACGTCRVYLEEKLNCEVSTASDDEQGVIEFSSENPEGQRLGCQIVVTPAFHNTTIKVATE